MRVIIAGSRSITDRGYVFKCIKHFREEFYISEIVSGMAPGVDQLGYEYAQWNNIAAKKFPADWEKYGKAAGFMRNEEMAIYAQGGALCAIWDGKSRGTLDMVERAKKHSVVVRLYELGWGMRSDQH